MTTLKYHLGTYGGGNGQARLVVFDSSWNVLYSQDAAPTISDKAWWEHTVSTSVQVSGDFYVGFLHTVAVDPTLGVDTSQPDGRSYEVPWEEKNLDYLIRAVLIPS